MHYMARGTKSFSARLDADVAQRLEARRERVGVTKSALAERYIDEGMRMDDHPGIAFRDGPAGRRASLVSGPDVWEVISTLLSGEDQGEQAIRATAQHLNRSEAKIRVAVGYYADFQGEIDAFIARNDQRAYEAEAAGRRQQALLA